DRGLTHIPVTGSIVHRHDVDDGHVHTVRLRVRQEIELSARKPATIDRERIGHMQSWILDLKVMKRLISALDGGSVRLGAAFDVEIDPLQAVLPNDVLIRGLEALHRPARSPQLGARRPAERHDDVAADLTKPVVVPAELAVTNATVAVPRRRARAVRDDEGQRPELVSSALREVDEVRVVPCWYIGRRKARREITH